MITARKSAWFERVFSVYNRNLIARRFEGLRVAGLDHLREWSRGDAPLVLYANHSSWWDGLIVFQIGYACRLEQYAMMEERQLREYPLFRRLGAFSVVRERPLQAARSIVYAGDLLRDSARALWIFPQGTTQPNDARPLKLYSGAANIIARLPKAYAAPVAMRSEFLRDFRPEAVARIGRPELFTAVTRAEVKNLTATFTANLASTLDELRDDTLSANFADYEEIVAPPRRQRKD